MTQRLKRWESPRRQGRNDKGKGGSARAKQLKKQTQMLRKKLKDNQKADNQNQQKGSQNKHRGRDCSSLPSFFCIKIVVSDPRHALPPEEIRPYYTFPAIVIKIG
ncbi:MAG TPA: hypothetical protein V6C91_10275 [Coleofasciculaceae cyanobacterium]